jgi:hypothetical protein
LPFLASWLLFLIEKRILQLQLKIYFCSPAKAGISE